MIYVSGLPDGTTESDLSEYFGSIGRLKLDKKTGKEKIWLYKDKVSVYPVSGEVVFVSPEIRLYWQTHPDQKLAECAPKFWVPQACNAPSLPRLVSVLLACAPRWF